MSEYDSIPSSLTGPSVDPHIDLISLLTTIQKCGVELLTTTWQPALECLGEGGTAEVSQSLVNRELSFAYKRTKEERLDAYKYIIPEILALGNPQVRVHPNVVDLIGVCWEIRNSVALPVLVFPKAELGDLRSFMQSSQGSRLEFGTRLHLCVDIARGLSVLHGSDIVHGDIKPQNILVHLDNDGTLLAKVSDLGYAGIGPDSRLIKLPRSRPWVDPDWNRREFTIGTARKMDMFSFGMVCLWVLFREPLLEYLRNCSFHKGEVSEQSIFFLSNETPQSGLESLQRTDQLASVMGNILKESSFLKDSQQINLTAFFNKLLCKDKPGWQSDWRELIRLVTGQAEDHSQLPSQADGLETTQPLHADFRIAAVNYRLCSSDYRVRSTIFDSLKARTNTKNKIYCQTCSKMASFQLAVCYKLGFGVPRDDNVSQFYLELSAQHQDDLENELLFIRQRHLDSTYTKSDIRLLFDQGHITGENLPDRYREQGELTRAESVYWREIADMQDTLGETHSVVLLLKSTLMSLLREGGKLQESEQLGIHVMEAFQASFGNEHPDTVISMENLARTWTEQRLWPRACEIQEHIVTLRTSEQGPNHASTLTAAANLATTYRVMGRLQEAEKIESQVVREFKLAFGETHPQTLEAMDRFALTLLAKEEVQESFTIREEVLEKKCTTLGSQHPSTLLAKGNLAGTYLALGRWKEAKAMYLETIESLRSALGDLHEQTLTCTEQLVGAYVKAQDFENAVQQQQHLVADRITKHGKSDPKTLRSIANLAEIYADGERLGEADEVISAVFLERKAAIASKHPDALTALSSAASVRLAQGRNDEAEALLTVVLEVEKQTLKTLSSNTITSMNNLAAVYVQQGRLPEARDLFLEVVSSFTDNLGPENQNTLQSSCNLARTYYKIGNFKEAKEILLAIRDVRVRKYGKDDPESMSFAEDLSLVYRTEGNWREAELLAEELSEISTRLLGSGHPDTLKRKRQLAGVYKQLERWEKAEDLYNELYVAKKSIDEIGNMETLAAGSQLFDIFKQQEKWSDAVFLLRELVILAKNGLGPDKPVTLLCMAQLATGLAFQGDLENATSIHHQVIGGLRKSNFDPMRTAILDVLSNLASKYADCDYWAESEQLYTAVIQDATYSLGPNHQTTLVSQKNLEAVQARANMLRLETAPSVSGK